MSKTERVGSAAATEFGIWTLVISLPSPAPGPAGTEISPCRHLPRQAEVHILTRDRDLLVPGVAALGQPPEHGLDELFGRRGAGGQADDLVPLEHVVVDR